MIIIFNILSQIIWSNDLLAHVKYLKTFELGNGDILLCTEKGVLLLEDGTEEIREIEESKFEIENTKEDFDFVTIRQFEEGKKFVVIIYKTVNFIFTSEGEYFTKGYTNFTTQGMFYTLVPYKIIRNNLIDEYHFLIGYLKNKDTPIFTMSDFSFNNGSRNLNLNYTFPLNLQNVYNTESGFL